MPSNSADAPRKCILLKMSFVRKKINVLLFKSNLKYESASKKDLDSQSK